jgi:hypothetical protein
MSGSPSAVRVGIHRCEALLVLAALCLMQVAAAGEVRVYTVEDLNDTEFDAYPPPGPVQVESYEFDVTTASHEEFIAIGSRRIRNLSVALENTGTGLIRAPYLFGPHGWDFRSLEAIAADVTEDTYLTNTEKFIRIHEWKGLHVSTVLGTSVAPYDNEDFAGNPLRILNQYGHAMCGESTKVVNALLRVVPPIGSMYGRKVKVGAHRTGEAYFDGSWHAYDATPGTGIVQWIYYDRDNKSIAPTWKYLIANRDLVSRTKKWTGFTAEGYLEGATGETCSQNIVYPNWDFTHDLRPGESFTMYFDMGGRLDRASARQDNSQFYRCYSDYGSAVFKYRINFKNQLYRKYVVKENNVLHTAAGLVPADPARPSSIIFDARSTWCFSGAEITACLKTTGKVSIGVNASPFDPDL